VTIKEQPEQKSAAEVKVKKSAVKSEVKHMEAKAEEVKTVEVKSEEAKPEETKPEEPKLPAFDISKESMSWDALDLGSIIKPTKQRRIVVK
jgi:hypothetical protein